jgi:ATP-binding cassette subfamily B protein
LLVTMVPLRVAAVRLEGSVAIEAGLLLKRRLLAGALALDPDATRAEGAGRMLGRVLESETVEHLALDAGGALVFSGVELLGSAAILAVGAACAIELTLFGVFVVAAIALGVALVRRRSEWTDARLALTHDMVERLVGHRTRVAQESREQWHDAEDQAESRVVRASARLDAIVITLTSVLPRAWLLASIGALCYAIVTGGRTPAGVAVTLGGAMVAFGALRRVSGGAGAVASVAIAWKRVAPLFDAAGRVEPPPPPAVAVEHDATSREPAAAVLEARDISYGYPRRRDAVLRGLELRIARNDHVLLTGSSGSGKSTLGAIVAGLRAPSSGLVLLDGLDARTLGAAAWRRRVASAPQFHENHVLGATFAFNILMGRAWPPAGSDLAAAHEICTELELGDLLQRMPAGLQQTVGETGWQLSHGERSRLFLARALLQEADVVVLDESFAALDPATLAKTVACAKRHAKALLVIAHP